MTLPTGNDSNRPDPGFDFLLSQQSAPIPPQRPRTADRRRPQVDTRSLALPLIISGVVIAAVIGAGVTWVSLVQSSEDQVKADSAAMCADLASTPGVLEQAAFGWPTSGGDLATTVASMKAYRDRWTALAASSAPTIKPDVTAVSTAAATIVDNIELTKSIDRPGSLAQMQSVTSATAISSWVAKYCV